jgi:hypothetical protein
MIAGIACAPGRRKPAWVADALACARADGVAALLWFEYEKETDWRVSHPPTVAAAARAALRTGG